MDQGLAVVSGAGIAFLGVAGTLFLQERRARAADDRTDVDREVRLRGVTRMMASELNVAHIRVRNASLEQLRHGMALSTAAWERYGPDVVAHHSWEVARKVQMAYGALDVFLHGNDGRSDAKFSEDAMRVAQSDPVRAERVVSALEENRAGVLRAISQGYNALHPYLGDANASEISDGRSSITAGTVAEPEG